jgi:hypothetical protein
MLPEIAASSAGLKAFCTFLTSQGIEDCRKCCGGNGYVIIIQKVVFHLSNHIDDYNNLR